MEDKEYKTPGEMCAFIKAALSDEKTDLSEMLEVIGEEAVTNYEKALAEIQAWFLVYAIELEMKSDIDEITDYKAFMSNEYKERRGN